MKEPIPSNSVCKILIFFLNFLCFCVLNTQAQEQPSFERFQYRKYHWKAYHGEKYHLYFPANAADSLFRFVVKELPGSMAAVKKSTIKELPKNLNIVLYPSVDQLYESNIGGCEPTLFTFPTFVFKGARIVLAFNGSYDDLEQQLNEGLVRAIWESEFREEGKDGADSKPAKNGNAIPFWYKEGAIRFLSNGWLIAAEDNLRRSFESQHFQSWQDVLNYQPRLGGQAFCYFLSEKYYPKVVAQTSFQLKSKNSLPRAIRLTTKHTLDSLFVQCFSFYSERFSNKRDSASSSIVHSSVPNKKGIVSNALFSPDRKYLIYTALANGKRSVYVVECKTQKTKKIAAYKLPPWIGDHSADQYPIVQWHGNGRQLYVMTPLKGVINVKRYGVDGRLEETVKLHGVDGITSFQPLSDREFLLTAFRKGQSDIVSYNDNKFKHTPYTDDEYDDAHPLFTGNGKELLFISNRPKEYAERRTYLIGVGYKKDTLWQGVYRINGKKLEPVKIDTTSLVKWDKPVLAGDNEVLLTNTALGQERSVLLNYANGAVKNLTTYEPFQYLSGSRQIVQYKSDKDSIYLTQQSVEDWIRSRVASIDDTTSPWLEDYKARRRLQTKEDSMLNSAKDTTHFFMENVFAQQAEIQSKKGRKKGVKSSAVSRISPYVLQLHSAFFTAKVNNDYFINRYQPYFTYQGQFKFPEVGALTKGGFTDLLENHHFTLAYGLPAATNGSTFFARYENTEKKFDWGGSYFRKVEDIKPDPKRNWVDENGNTYPNNAKVKTHYYELFVKRPLSFYSSIRFQTALRYDKTIFVALDKYSLDFASLKSAWSINTLSYRLDKLQQTLPNLYKGFTAHAGVDACTEFNQKGAYVIGSMADFSYHQPIYKYITMVAQAHIGYSYGSRFMLYNLGGKDNNLTPQTDSSVHFAQDAPYAFQTLITPFRGHLQNSLYGSQYVLLNMDVYFPIFQTLIPIRTPLPFVNNIQLGLLSDVAGAKESWNEKIPDNGKRLWSYGISARSVLAGYPLRLDVAWPGTFGKKPVWYFSLSLQ